MPDFRPALTDGRVYIFDGGYGALMPARGLPPGQSPELFGMERPEVIADMHREFMDAGARVLTTNTFGGTSFKLGLGVDVYALNRRMAEVARSVAGDTAFVAGSVGPTGHFVEPLGDLSFRGLVEAFKEQIRGLADGGADLILGETHFDLAEARAVVIAAREVCSLPVGVSMTFESGCALTGASPATFIDAMMNLGADFAGTNCGLGPDQLRPVVAGMLPRAGLPLLVQPNAGLAELDGNGRTVFPLAPEPFGAGTAAFLDLGAKFLGGCCGSTPAHIAALAAAVGHRGYARPEPSDTAFTVLTSRSRSTALGGRHRLAVIGERINPTGKKALSAELAAGGLSEALRLGSEQSEIGVGALDVNVGAPMVNEPEVLPALVKALVSRFQEPLSLDTSNPEAMEAALWAYPGSALVNSISGEPGRMERLGPLCKKFGAPFILLPLQGKKLPYTAAERLAIVERLLAQAESLGIPRRLIVVDALALTVSSRSDAALHCLQTIRHCTEQWGLATVVGLSNVSFGLPARELLNTAFLTMAAREGLSACIANPGSARLRESLAACEVLLNRDAQASAFIGGYTDWKPGSGGASGGGTIPSASGAAPGGAASGPLSLRQAVVKGAKDSILSLLEDALSGGTKPFDLVHGELIPGIMDVGEKYERREYFLPQLILSAETLQVAMGRLNPLLEQAGEAAERPVVVMATVEGDIHDIGKNIVCLLLRNHGFEVVDLGKDVPAADIVAAAKAKGAKVIGLSALMTTTMVRMEDVVRQAAEEGLSAKIMVGGAVVTEAFAKSIGAHGYAADAVGAVRTARELAGA
jgi:5-methyltetrahydrofolate--homocysteine methyltransferase